MIKAATSSSSSFSLSWVLLISQHSLNPKQFLRYKVKRNAIQIGGGVLLKNRLWQTIQSVGGRISPLYCCLSHEFRNCAAAFLGNCGVYTNPSFHWKPPDFIADHLSATAPFKTMAASRKALFMVFLGLLVFKSNSLTAKSVYDAQLHNAHVAKGHENMQKSSQRHPLAWFSLVFSWLTQPPAEMSFKQQQMFPAVSSNPSTRLSQQTQNLNENISVCYF